MARLINVACILLAGLIWTVALGGGSLPVAIAFIAVELLSWKRLHARRAA